MSRYVCVMPLVCAVILSCNQLVGNSATERPGHPNTKLCTDGDVGPSLEIGSLLATGGHARVAGKVSVGANVYVNGVRIDVDSEGRFAALVAKYAWSQTVVVAFDKSGCTEWNFAEQVTQTAR